MSTNFDLELLPSKTLMGLAVALEDSRLDQRNVSGDLYEVIYEVLGERGENRFCGTHLELLVAPDWCDSCLALPENAQYRADAPIDYVNMSAEDLFDLEQQGDQGAAAELNERGARS